MKTAFALLAVAAFSTTSVFATRIAIGQPMTAAELVSQSRWIFAGRVLRCESSSAGSPIGTAHVTFTVLAGLPLRGTPPKRIVLIGLRASPFDVPTNQGSVLIFFAAPTDYPIPGIDGTYSAIHRYTSAEIKEIQALVRELRPSK